MSCPSTHRNLHPLGIASRRTSVLWFTSHPSAWVRRSVTASTTLACDRTRRWPGYVIFKVNFKQKWFLWFSSCCWKDMIVFICYHKHTYTQTQTQTYRQTCIPLPHPRSLPPPSPMHTLCADWLFGGEGQGVCWSTEVWYMIMTMKTDETLDKFVIFLWLIKMRKLRWYVN